MAEYITFQPSDYVNPVLYTGNASTNAITGVGFQPDFVTTKSRNATYDWVNYDAVRGATKEIRFNGDWKEETGANLLQSFDSDGFTLGLTDTSNNSGTTFVSYNFKAGTTSGITGGTITPSSYSINTTSGFGIYAYAGTGSAGTIAHGLGVTPQLIIIKCLSANSTDWVTWIHPMAVNEYMYMNSTATKTSDTDFMNSVLPSSTLISLGTKANVNGSGKTFIAYCYANKQGYSKFGSYTGNGNADGPFVYTGFKPAIVMIKRTDVAGGWYTYDRRRAGYNGSSGYLQADTTSAEDTNAGNFGFDIVATGFKLRGTYATVNADSGNFEYMAFAEFPTVSSNGVAVTAR